MLFLEDYKGMTDEEVRENICHDFGITRNIIDIYDILIAYKSEGECGCDSSSFLLLRNKETKELFENHGSHCSCNGFEEQFEPRPTSFDYLRSDSFYISFGGDDCYREENDQAVKNFIKNFDKIQDLI